MVKAHETFVKELKIKQPNLIVLDNYVHSNQKLRVQDSLGIIYLAEPAKLLRGCKLNITTAIDKYDYFLKNLKKFMGINTIIVK